MSGGSFTGDDFALDALIEALNPEALKTAIVERAVVKVAEVAAAQYAAGEGPDGNEWPLNRNGAFPSLSRLTAGIQFRATPDGIAATGDEVLRYHAKRSEGYSHLARPVFPDEGELSAPWAEAADEGAAEVFSERLGGR